MEITVTRKHLVLDATHTHKEKSPRVYPVLKQITVFTLRFVHTSHALAVTTLRPQTEENESHVYVSGTRL